MSIKVWALASMMAVVAGEAGAATHNVIVTVTRSVHSYYPIEAEWPVDTELSDWRGLAVYTPFRGLLEISETGWASLDVAGLRIFNEGGMFEHLDGSLSWLEGTGWSFTALTWMGEKGSLEYAQDGLPDYYMAWAEIELAPVPLPATAALLPMGVGALAWLRRRQRR